MTEWGHTENGGLWRVPAVGGLETAFNVGLRTELIKLAYVDFKRLVSPEVVDFRGEVEAVHQRGACRR